ncbi:hypothetical protein [Hoylesella nanceiensis]|uniref:hypothetical protein n=2 Tax=Hoylesella nanceiensis TaxID=425941 RepID=UPI0028E6F1F1|nr:hypothetical protein [Hoylesella nanceiensis]
MEWISNDFERQLRYKIAHYDYLDTFPKMADFGVNQSDFDDYVIEKQSVLDMEGNARKRYTLLALIFLLPFFVLSAFPEQYLPLGNYTFLVGFAIGFLLVFLQQFIIKKIKQKRLKNMYHPQIERYIEAVNLFSVKQ